LGRATCRTALGAGKVGEHLPKELIFALVRSRCSTKFLVTKIKKDLIHKAKVKKSYAKVKAELQEAKQVRPKPKLAEEPTSQGESGEDKEDEEGHSDGGAGAGGSGSGHAEHQLHPTRELMLRDEERAQANAGRGDNREREDRNFQSDGQRRRTRRPGYYDKQLTKAQERRAEAEQRAQEMQRRREERERKLAERDRYKRAMAKTRDKDGKKKLGRESTLLLDKVKKLVAEG
jgi:hypothetical protein